MLTKVFGEAEPRVFAIQGGLGGRCGWNTRLESECEWTNAKAFGTFLGAVSSYKP